MVLFRSVTQWWNTAVWFRLIEINFVCLQKCLSWHLVVLTSYRLQTTKSPTLCKYFDLMRTRLNLGNQIPGCCLKMEDNLRSDVYNLLWADNGYFDLIFLKKTLFTSIIEQFYHKKLFTLYFSSEIDKRKDFYINRYHNTLENGAREGEGKECFTTT